VTRGYLFDTSVISALAPGKPAIPEQQDSWLREQADRLFIPTVAIAEIEAGIRKLRRSGGTARAEHLGIWLDGLIAGYGDRILAFDTTAARMAGSLADAAVAVGRHPGFPDVAIAAIAWTQDLTLLTRNLRHFEPLGVLTMDPFGAPSAQEGERP
jgi:predicted nucleic acid-binding protein